MSNSNPFTVLDSQQESLRKCLFEKDTGLAAIYYSAICVLKQYDNPDRLCLSAHNLRELMQMIPLIVDIKIKPSEALGPKCRQLYSSWKKLGPLCSTSENRSLKKKIDKFFIWYEKNTSTRSEQLKETFRALDPAKHKVPKAIEELNVKFYNIIKDYFIKIAHHNAIAEPKEFKEYLYQMEMFLIDRLKPRIFNDIAEIDEVLNESSDNA
jgi:hypothetical protein